MLQTGSLTESHRSILESMLEQETETNLRDSLPSTLGVEVFGSVCQGLQGIGNSQVQETLNHIVDRKVPPNRSWEMNSSDLRS